MPKYTEKSSHIIIDEAMCYMYQHNIYLSVYFFHLILITLQVQERSTLRCI